MTARTFPLTMNLPLTAGVNEPRCVWSRKIRKLVNGKRTPIDIAELMHLPQQVVARLVTQGLRDGTLNMLSDEPTIVVQELTSMLEHHLGDAAHTMLDAAYRMTCMTPGQITEENLPDLLIALELCAAPSQRIGLHGLLDGFRRARCA